LQIKTETGRLTRSISQIQTETYSGFNSESRKGGKEILGFLAIFEFDRGPTTRLRFDLRSYRQA
jgi:hypothetical protein